ncbi:ABC transporter substrate-binding protein [Blastococcus sp. SYSU D00820]
MAVDYIGGSAGAADDSLDPLTIGWINEQGGSGSKPEATAGLEAAVQLVNEELGGIDGHPLEVVTCFVTSEEEAQQCAQQMYNDASVSMVLTGGAATGAGAIHSILAPSKPILGSQASSPADLSAENAHYLGAGPFGQAPLAKYIIDELGAKSVAVIGPAFQGTTVTLQQIEALASEAGVTVTSGTYPQGSADVSSAVLASDARQADAVLVIEPSSSGCTAVANAITQYAITAPVVSLSSCADQATVGEALGDLPQWTYPLSTLVPSTTVEDESGEVAVFLDAMQTYQPDANTFGLAPISFASGMYAAKLLTEVGADAVTPEALSAAIGASTGPVFMSVPELAFGQPPLTTVGSTALRFYSYEGDGSWSAASDDWIS